MTATLNVNPTNGGSTSIDLTGNSLTPTPVVAIRNTANTLDLTSQNVGSANLGGSVAYVFTIRNSGDALINNVASSQTVTGAHAAEFARTTTCGASLLPGATCTVTITFTPTRAGLREAKLNIAPTNVVMNPAPKSVDLTGNGTGIRIMNDVAQNLTNVTQKRWLVTPTLAPGGSLPSDIARVSFEVDLATARDIDNVEIGTSTTTNDTAPGGFQDITDLLGANIQVERKAGSGQALVHAEVPLSVTSLGTGNGQYGFSDGTVILVCLGGGDYKTDNRRLWFRVTDDQGNVSQPVGSIVRFQKQAYACPDSQGPQLNGARILEIDGASTAQRHLRGSGRQERPGHLPVLDQGQGSRRCSAATPASSKRSTGGSATSGPAR